MKSFGTPAGAVPGDVQAAAGKRTEPADLKTLDACRLCADGYEAKELYKA